ncbi:MAG TPA: hypothetical protein VMS32_05425 [Verrucomicrobiae bacterium]|nr:hypothetical protein [Verrucomicrobiae bacterium]
MVVGGSAITAHVPHVYTSNDIDLAIVSGINHRRIAAALEPIGFALRGRSYLNPTSPFPIDIVADTPWVDQRPITEYASIETVLGSFETLRLEDAVADRVAAFLYWNDAQSLDVAERATAGAEHRPTWGVLRSTLLELEAGAGEIGKRFELALERLGNIYHCGGSS